MNPKLVTITSYPNHVLRFRYFLLTLLALLGLYALVYPLMVDSMTHAEDSIYISVPFFMTFGILSALFVFRSGIPKNAFGLSMNEAFSTVITSIQWSLFFILILTCVKWGLTIAPTKWEGKQVIELTFFKQFRGFKTLLIILVYIIFVPVQEFIVRSALMGSLLYYLNGKMVPVITILISALLYSLAHLYMGWFVSLAVLVPGVFWSFLFYRTRSLLAVSISHALIGLYTLFFLNLI